MKEKEIINICIVFNDSDGEYTRKIFPTIFSILENNKGEKINLYVICKGIRDEYKNYLKEIFNVYKQAVFIIDDFGNKEYLVEFFKKNNFSSWNYGIYFKLLIPLLLPKSVEKVINFDSDDIIVNGNLKEFWNLDLDENLIASVVIPNKTNKIQGNIERLNISKPFRIGSNLYNLVEFRKIDFEEEFKEIIIKNAKILKYPELDILNIICDKRVLYINETYNYVSRNYKVFEKKLVYHFAGKKIHLFKYIFGVNKKYLALYEKYNELSKYKVKKQFSLLVSLNSIYFFNILIRYILKFLDFFNMRQFVKRLLNI